MIRDTREIKLAAIAGLKHAHENSGQPDENEISVLKIELDDSSTAPDSAKCHAALFYANIGEFSQARSLEEQVSNDYTDAYINKETLKGWTNLIAGRDTTLKEAESIFKAGGEEKSKSQISHLAGLATVYQKKKAYDDSTKVLNKIIVSHEYYIPALIMKAENLIAQNKWLQAFENLKRVTSREADNVEALILILLYHMVNSSDMDTINNELKGVVKRVLEKEPSNHVLFSQLAQLLANLSTKNGKVLEGASKLIEAALGQAPFNSAYHTTAAYIALLKGDYESANQGYQTALEYEESNLEANKGLIHCLALQNNYQDAELILDSLNQIQESLDDSLGSQAQLTFLNGLLAWRSTRDKATAIELLNQTVQQFKTENANATKGVYYFVSSNPQFLMDVAEEYMVHLPSEPREATDPVLPIVANCQELLSILTSAVPGNLGAQLMFARVEFINRNFSKATTLVKKCTQLNKKYTEAHLLASQVAYAEGNISAAKSSLERAQSLNFAVKEWPEYALLKAKIAAFKGDHEKARNILTKAIAAMKKKGTDIKDHTTVHVSIYLQLALALSKLNKSDDATDIISDALSIYRNTDHVGLIHIDHAKIMAEDNADAAIRILQRIGKDDRNYMRAMSVMANIHLHHRHDKESFSRVYEQLIENTPKSVKSYIFMGDAYLSIQEPEKAIESYKKALQIDAENIEALSKIGKSLFTTHSYEECITYFKNAIAIRGSDTSLRYDLAHIYMKLKRFSLAEGVIKEMMPSLHSKSDLDVIESSRLVKTLMLMANVQAANSNVPEAIKVLEEAKTVQKSILANMHDEEARKPFAKTAADICYEQAVLSKNNPKMLPQYCSQGISLDGTHEACMELLADVHLNRDDLESCESLCMSLLRVNPHNEKATMTLASIKFKDNKFEEAIQYFEKLLQNKPDNFTVLSKLVGLLYRSGKVDDCVPFIERAAKAIKGSMNPGLHYCKGLHYRYTHQLREALTEFNHARNSSEWGELSIVNMIDIYLGEVISWEDPSKVINSSNNKMNLKHAENVEAAENLLENLTTRTIGPMRKELLRGYILIASRKKPAFEAAQKLFMQVMKEYKVSTRPIPALVGLSAVFIAMRQPLKARNNLKMLKKTYYTRELADDFEHGWLMLANLYINMQKYDLAIPQLENCIAANKSCAKAHELRGLVYAKGMAYKDAANCYEKAWNLLKKSDPVVGYKLAFNYMKADRFVEAIDVCHQVLAVDPDYPRIRKDILNKARASLRP